MYKFTIILLLLSFNAFAQADEARIARIRGNAKIDNQDIAIFNVLEDFYGQVLQSGAGELSSETTRKFNSLFTNTRTKNRHLLIMFIAYQNHISQTAQAGKKPNPTFQAELMTDLAYEFKNIFNKVPAIIFVYRFEALETSGQKEEAAKVIEEGLKEYPTSVPLKVYKYLGSKDAVIKTDLVTNHSNHWMVKQFAIK